MVTVAEALHRGTRYLDGKSPSPRLDCEVLLCHALAWPRSRLFARPDTALAKSDAWRYGRLLRQRGKGVPVAYLTGAREFWSMNLRVGPATLIPRPETEELVALALQLIPPNSEMRIIDLGTGSGAIALAIASERPRSQITAVDNSAAALEVTRLNVADHQLRNVRLLHSNWFEALSGEHFDIVVANPPYIAEGDPRLEPEVRAYEPYRALISGRSGYEDLERIAEDALNHLVDGGHLLMEHGPGQSAQMVVFLESLGYHSVTTHYDLSGRDRIVQGRYNR